MSMGLMMIWSGIAVILFVAGMIGPDGLNIDDVDNLFKMQNAIKISMCMIFGGILLLTFGVF